MEQKRSIKTDKAARKDERWVSSRRRKNKALLALLLLFVGTLYVLSIVKYL